MSQRLLLRTNISFRKRATMMPKIASIGFRTIQEQKFSANGTQAIYVCTFLSLFIGSRLSLCTEVTAVFKNILSLCQAALIL